MMTGQKCGKRGGNSEPVESGDGYGKRDGKCELAEQDAGGTGEQCDGHEYGHENQGSGDYRACHFFHGDRSGIVGFGYALDDMTLHVFDNYDGVVDDQAGRAGDAGWGRSIDRGPEG